MLRKGTGQLSKCNRRSTLFTFRILVTSHKRLKGTKPLASRYSINKIKQLSKFTGKNLWWSPFIVKLQSPTSLKKNSITGIFLLLLLNFSEQLLWKLPVNGCFWRDKLVNPKVKVNNHTVNFVKKETST